MDEVGVDVFNEFVAVIFSMSEADTTQESIWTSKVVLYVYKGYQGVTVQFHLA
jgi:hypothetical protein